MRRIEFFQGFSKERVVCEHPGCLVVGPPGPIDFTTTPAGWHEVLSGHTLRTYCPPHKPLPMK